MRPRELLRRASYLWAPRVASALRRRWVLARNPHCDIRFEGPVYLGPGFSVFSPEGGTLVVGAAVEFRRGFRVELHRGATVRVGAGTVFTYDNLIQCTSTIEIGERCLFAQAASVVDGSHRFRDLDRPVLQQGYDLRPIRIGDDVSIMSKSTVIADVGERSMVGAGAVVTRAVPPFSVAAGVPARVIDSFAPA